MKKYLRNERNFHKFANFLLIANARIEKNEATKKGRLDEVSNKKPANIGVITIAPVMIEAMIPIISPFFFESIVLTALLVIMTLNIA